MSSPAGIQQDVVALAKIANPLIFNLGMSKLTSVSENNEFKT